MGMSANVLSVQALEDLKAALARFGGEAHEALNAAQLEIRRTLDWLAERLQYWQNEVRRRQQLLAQAQAALARCRASGMRDPKTGAYREPPCTAEWEAARQAEARLREAEAELRSVQHWKQAVEQAAADYGRQAGRLATQLNCELPKASALLGRKVATLQSYVLMGAPAASAPPPVTPAFTTTPPGQAAADTITAAVQMAAVSAALTGVAMYLLGQLASNVRLVLGPVGEQLAARLLEEGFGWKELAFDQPHHGFDRVFMAPGSPIIVMESKVTRTGQFQPGQTAMGEQGSPEWLAAHAGRMADPGSAEWSPKNERIAALINEIGPENVPVVAVVIETDTGLADVYYRLGDSPWQPLREGISIQEALT
jgi:hypothetical protein